MNEPNALVIIPTWNEANNIGILLKEIVEQYPFVDVLVVDAHSTDGTGALVREFSKNYPQVHLVEHSTPGRFGEALKVGFKYALEHEYDPVITMDGDLSHSPHYLKDFFATCDRYDLVIGSRYVDGVRVEGWRFRKLLVSKLANMFVSYILIKPVWDFTSGFRCYRRKLLQAIDIDEIYKEAYIAQIQLLHLAYQKHFRVKEIPTIYRGTPEATSKVSAHTRLKTLRYVFKFRAPWWEIIRHFVYFKREYERFVEEYDEFINPPELKNNGNFEVKDFYRVSIGVMAYNEEKLIGKCLSALQQQELQSGAIEEIIVVSSGSTDRTNEIVKEFAAKDSRIRLLEQPQRLGKASAINAFLQEAHGEIVVVESADTIAGPQAVEQLIRPFKHKEIGMTGAHPMPVNKPTRFVGYCVHKLWDLHHRMALQNPKCGEMVAFRNIISRIPKYTAVDEAAIEAIISRAGLKLAYVPEAIVYNKGPETIRDFFKQRRRIASGHRHLYALFGYRVTSLNTKTIIKLVWQTQRWNPRDLFFTFWLIFLEGIARLMGLLDFYLRDKNPFIWDISQSTKQMDGLR